MKVLKLFPNVKKIRIRDLYAPRWVEDDDVLLVVQGAGGGSPSTEEILGLDLPSAFRTSHGGGVIAEIVGNVRQAITAIGVSFPNLEVFQIDARTHDDDHHPQFAPPPPSHRLHCRRRNTPPPSTKDAMVAMDADAIPMDA